MENWNRSYEKDLNWIEIGEQWSLGFVI